MRAGVVDSQVLPDRWCIGRAPEAMTRMCLAISSHTRAFDLRHQPPKHQEHSSQSPLSRNGQEQKHVLFLLAADTSSARVHKQRKQRHHVLVPLAPCLEVSVTTDMTTLVAERFTGTASPRM